jgi:hypothetical protein
MLKQFVGRIAACIFRHGIMPVKTIINSIKLVLIAAKTTTEETASPVAKLATGPVDKAAVLARKQVPVSLLPPNTRLESY